MIGDFDENIFMYFEDNLISRKIINNGYENIIVTGSTLHHMCNGSSKTTDKTSNDKLTYFKNWQYGWSYFYFISELTYKNDKKISNFYKKKYLLKLKLKWLKNKLYGKSNLALDGIINGCIAYNNGADPFTEFSK